MLKGIALATFGGVLLFAMTTLPERGKVDAPAHRSTTVTGSRVAADYYIRSSVKDAQTQNIVTAILGDYRSYDTLGEVIVVLTAGLCCSLILRRRDK